jgi:hypothetical protein
MLLGLASVVGGALLGAALAASDETAAALPETHAATGPIELHSYQQIGVAMFPAGVQYIFEGEARLPLWAGSKSPLLADTNLALVGHAELTPSFPRLGAMLRVAPVAFWDATLRVDGTWYFGAFSSILPFDDPAWQATAENKRAAIADGDRTGGWGVRFDAETRLKGKVGPIIAVLELQYRHHHVEGAAPGAAGGEIAWFWEPTEMLNVAGDGDVVNRNAYLFAELRKPVRATPGGPQVDDRKLWLGVIGMWQGCPQSGDRNVRVGPVFIWKPARGPTAPTILGGAQAWVVSNFTPVLPPYSFVAASWSR